VPAARTKPVVVLKAGRSLERLAASSAAMEPVIAPDTVFDAALMRAGTVRVRTYAQLFAAARILAMGKIPRGDRLAIVSNGRGPGILAADYAAGAGVALAQLGPATVKALDALLPPEIARENPVDVRGDAPPDRLAGAVAALLSILRRTRSLRCTCRARSLARWRRRRPWQPLPAAPTSPCSARGLVR
jgi:acetyltransferase